MITNDRSRENVSSAILISILNPRFQRVISRAFTDHFTIAVALL